MSHFAGSLNQFIFSSVCADVIKPDKTINNVSIAVFIIWYLGVDLI